MCWDSFFMDMRKDKLTSTFCAQNLVSKHETNKMISILDFEQNLLLNLHCGALLLCFLQKLTLLDTTHETQGVTKTYL